MNIIYDIETGSDIDNNMTDKPNPQPVPREIPAKKEAEAKQDAEAKERLKKEAEAKKKALEPKPKFYFDVKVECMLPATLTYRVLAEDAQQAFDLIRGLSPNSVKHRLIGRREIKVMVYDAGSTMIKWMKNLLG